MSNITKSIFLLAVALISAQISFGQKTRYQRILGGDKEENNYAIDRTLDGGFIMTGYTTSFGQGGEDIYLIKTNAMGQVEWSKAYGNTKNETGWSVKSTTDSGYIVCGTTNSNTMSKGFMMKTDKNGTISWSIEIAGDSIADFYNVIQSKFGSYYAVGYAYNDTLKNDMFVAKLNRSGNMQWARKIGSKGNEEAYAIAEDEKGYLAIVGITDYDSATEGGRNGSYGDHDVVVTILDSFGNIKHSKNYGSVDDETGWDIKALGRDKYVITGWTKNFPFGDNDIFAMIIDTAGNYNSVFGYGSANDDRVFDVETSSDGTFSLSGYMQPSGGDRDVLVLNSDAKGNLTSYNIIGGSGQDGHWPTDGIRTRDGGFMILSSSKSFRTNKGNDFYLIRTNERFSAGCNEKIDLLNVTQGTFNSYTFGQMTYSYTFASTSFTTTNISGFDSTLCCYLEARVVADTLKLCEGKSTSIGKEAISGYTYKWTADNSSFTSTAANPSVSPTTTTKYKLVVSSTDKTCKSDSAYVVVQVFSTIKADLARDTTFCSGDTVTINAYAGLNGYLWLGKTVQAQTQSIRVFATDTIFFSVFDNNGCFYTDTVKTLRYNLPVFNLGNDTTICENLPITLNGPNGMKTYNWNNGEANGKTLVTKTEKKHNLVVVDNNGCTYSDEIQIFTNPFSTFTLGPDTSFCEGTTFTILGPGALNGYIWNGVPNPIQNFPTTTAGTYTLTAFNSFKCPYSDTIVLSVRKAPAFDLGDSIILCFNTVKTMSGPANMASYKWSNGPTTRSQDISIAGKYTLRVTDSTGCSYTDTVFFTQKFPPVIDLGNDTLICFGDSILLDAGAGYSAYAWNNGKTTRTIYAAIEANYIVQVTDKFGCVGVDDKQVDTMKCSTGSINLPQGMQIKVYPNPTNGKVNLHIDGNRFGTWHYTLLDITGKIIEQNKIDISAYNQQVQFDLSDQPKGVYVIRLQNAFGSANYKIVKE